MKLLAIQFRYLGDAVLMTPALRAVKRHFPGSELHVVVAEELVPVLRHLPWLDRVWGFPRVRGKARVTKSWPLLRGLRRERFDRSIDFGGNDRGALLSLFCGAPARLGPLRKGGFLGRRLCYTETVQPVAGMHEMLANFHIVSVWGVGAPESPELEIAADPAYAEFARRFVPSDSLLCHVAASQPKKEWPLSHWVDFYQRATSAGMKVIFTSGVSPRERALLDELKRMLPTAATVRALPELGAFISLLKCPRLFIGGSTGPLHLAAGLGVPTVGLFRPGTAAAWAPLGQRHHALEGGLCECGDHTAVCHSDRFCMAAISPTTVWRAVTELLSSTERT